MMKAEDVIIIEHPYMYDRYAIAKVISVAKRMVTVAYWDFHDRCWKDEAVRRQIASVKRVLVVHPAPATDLALHTVALKLKEMDQQLSDIQKATRSAFFNKIMEITVDGN